MTERQVPYAGVQRTAIGVARTRAAESRRADRLFDDPYAEAFHREATRGVPDYRPPERTPGRAAMAAHIVLRTRFFDEYLRDAVRDGCRQVVLLAAGLDTRAFRLPWPDGTRLFEIDLPEMIAFKERVLAAEHAVPACERHVLVADLNGDWGAKLTAAGFDPAVRTAWLVEGLLVYLDRDEAVSVLRTVAELSTPGSRLSLTEGRSGRAVAEERGAGGEFAGLLALWKGGLGEPAAGWLAGEGWRVTPYSREELERAYGRAGGHEGFAGFLIAERD